MLSLFFCMSCSCTGVLQGSDKQSEVRIKKFMTMMDSMTEKELNTNDIKVLTQPSRILRISRGAGRSPQDYQELLGEGPSAVECQGCVTQQHVAHFLLLLPPNCLQDCTAQGVCPVSRCIELP